MAEFPEFSLHLLDVSNFQLKSSARFPEMDPTDLREMRESNQNKVHSKKNKNRVKVFDLWRAQSEA